jgi:hypothetical protein
LCCKQIRDISVKKKYPVKMFSVYTLEVNFKNFTIFNLLYLRFCFGPCVFAGNSSLRVCGVVPSTHYTQTHTLLQQLTNKQLFSSHHTTSHLTWSEKLPLHERQLTRLNWWTLGHWMLGSADAGVTPLAHLENFPRPHMISLDAPVFRSCCPKPIQISSLGTGTRLSYAHSSQTAY